MDGVGELSESDKKNCDKNVISAGNNDEWSLKKMWKVICLCEIYSLTLRNKGNSGFSILYIIYKSS